MLVWEDILKKNGKTSKVTETNKITTPGFVKQLRNKLNMSQRLFAKVLGVSVKTVEKWEQGANPVKGAASRLLYLLDKNENLIEDLYLESNISNNIVKEYKITYRNNETKSNHNKFNYNYNYNLYHMTENLKENMN